MRLSNTYPTRTWPGTIALVAVALALATCAAPATTPTTTEAPETTTTTVGTLDSESIYAEVSESLAFVETGLGTGSGVLFDPTHVVTNAHVVWPDRVAAVSFPGGAAGDAPVTAVDWLADLAVLDVSGIDGLPQPAVLGTGSDLAVGAELFLVGYPADDASDPTPAITAGVLSRRRDWADAGLTYLQSDAFITGGQSGGALVATTGEVVGISGLSLENGFALSLAAADVLDRLGALLAGDDPAGLGDRWLDTLTGRPSLDVVVPHRLAEEVFVFEASVGDEISLGLGGEGAFSAALVGPDGFLEHAIDDTSVEDSISLQVELDGPYFLGLAPLFGEDVAASVDAGIELTTLIDPDHGRPLTVGTVTAGNTDYPGDFDWYVLELTEGETVVVRASSTNTDPGLVIDWLENPEPDGESSDSDSGGGVLGFDAEIEYTAPFSGSFVVVVLDESQFGPGGYLISVEAA